MALPEHSKIINRTAKKVFNEYGIVQKGQSRIWLDDQYWYSTIIEFQPSGRARGTYLNIGICFHWYKQDHLSFDIGYREKGFCEYKNEEQFENIVIEFVKLGLEKVLLIRKKLVDLQSTQETILNYDFERDTVWSNYHKAIISGLNNQPNESERYFNLILKNKLEYDWQLELKLKVEQLILDLNNISDFKSNINEVIMISRNEKKLKSTSKINVW
ncbi:hypothetical protein QSV08_07780 [Maribacter sp. BPC-D8]|uniref:hypothetical protein n=1 Tax=Maribacter sp. BPC-D8 TaxID=3053613 RepID=UPI002B4A5B40|nr:hypothetical protein [Maribacter sp. BPC-D8]WRI31144.1 hypothetical protein QSV08_07780 [Maribacter sp. BPC-D8]